MYTNKYFVIELSLGGKLCPTVLIKKVMALYGVMHAQFFVEFGRVGPAPAIATVM
jgi:hypothetical protein